MIVRSRIRQSFQKPWGFTLEVGDNKFDDNSPGPVLRMFRELARAKLVEVLTDEQFAAEQSPALVGSVAAAPAPPSTKPGTKKAAAAKRAKADR
jgi:hypothetical protein